jgi:hypothetical protein
VSMGNAHSVGADWDCMSGSIRASLAFSLSKGYGQRSHMEAMVRAYNLPDAPTCEEGLSYRLRSVSEDVFALSIESLPATVPVLPDAR